MVVGVVVFLFVIGRNILWTEPFQIYVTVAAGCIVVITGFVIAYGALTRNASLNATQVGPYQFVSTLHVGALCWIAFSNLLAIVLSVGLLMPWARVRITRYLATNLIMHGPPDLDMFVQGSRPESRALGEEASDFFDVDIGGV
jgi:uncharacterized membrane protein YjgN (DUF898 family)